MLRAVRKYFSVKKKIYKNRADLEMPRVRRSHRVLHPSVPLPDYPRNPPLAAFSGFTRAGAGILLLRIIQNSPLAFPQKPLGKGKL